MKKINPPGSRILVVDDQPFNVLAIKLLLHQFSWIEVDSIYDGKSALTLVVYCIAYIVARQ
jgi:CheY-like chemotaxis protein